MDQIYNGPVTIHRAIFYQCGLQHTQERGSTMATETQQEDSMDVIGRWLEEKKAKGAPVDMFAFLETLWKGTRPGEQPRPGVAAERGEWERRRIPEKEEGQAEDAARKALHGLADENGPPIWALRTLAHLLAECRMGFFADADAFNPGAEDLRAGFVPLIELCLEKIEANMDKAIKKAKEG
jgi:hypothetical protein